MDVLVYGFARAPGALPEIMNVGAGTLRLRFRGLSEAPSFTGHDAVLLPFDAYLPWREGGEGERRLTELHLRAQMEVRRAAAAGVSVGFLYEDAFAHDLSSEDLVRLSLGGMVLEGLGLEAAPLPGPVDRMQVLAPAFASFLRRFGVAESYLEARRPVPGLHPLCRTPARQLTGVALQEGKGSILFLPGDPRHRFLEFFTSLGQALAHEREGLSSGTDFLFTEERELLAERERTRSRLAGIEMRLDQFRRRRRLLALVAANLERRLPEWFATFLGLELVPAGEAGVFFLEEPPRALLGATASYAGDALLGLEEIRDELVASERLEAGRPTLLFLAAGATQEPPAGAGSETPFDLAAESARAGIHLFAPDDLLRLIDREPAQVTADALVAGLRGRASAC